MRRLTTVKPPRSGVVYDSLTKSQVWTKDLMFATLDPTTRSLHLKNGHQVLLTDTVGMLSDLPHDLIEAFQATLEEIQEADLILYVVDGAHASFERHMLAVDAELERMGLRHRRQILVFNKMDIVSQEARQGLKNRWPDAVLISAQTGEGLEELRGKFGVIVDT
ncbi:MAG: 50S ribosome-binding GTPase [Candidatus Omnitrophica bacterium]|nr:50S ribosome-binding GTPase [Candidatus Omnitrophota bacterium]